MPRAGRARLASAPSAEATGPSGAVTLTAPAKRNDGDTRTQAALLVTGRRSFTTLERIGRLQEIASDETVPVEIRAASEG